MSLSDSKILSVRYHLLRGSAKQSVNDGLGSVWQHGNFNTSQLRNLSSYNDETVDVWLRRWDEHIYLPSLVRIRPLGVALRIREIYTSCDFSSSIPALLPFFLRTCTGQTHRDDFTYNGPKDAVWRSEVPSQQVFYSHWTFWGSVYPPTPNISPACSTEIPAK